MAATDPTGDVPAAATPRGGRNLPVAIGVGLALATAFIGSLLIHPLVFLTFVAVNLVVALYELDEAFATARAGARPPTAVAAAALPVMLFGSWAWGGDAIVAGLFGGMIAGFGAVMITHQRGQAVDRIGGLAVQLLWVNGFASSLGLLLARDEGYWYVLAGAGLAITNDIGAYAFGRNFGRTRMAPGISPAKSWEGFAGALATTVVMALVVTAQLVPGVTPVSAVVLALAVAVAATLGDLAESMVKRDLGVKDLGTIFPGHGGVMDRVDGLLFALPTTHLVLQAFGI
ncbi:phosphatidate cytidylyltransferase [Euzebya sp.]|uniref:phosphatidate cytidylyltransferase n=1 Tax=Euzebya sp. TaxID=1971409 RepID=UPI0035124DE2